MRDLKLDGNTIKNLEGIMQLDLLVKLSAKGNKIASIDFSKATWSASPVFSPCKTDPIGRNSKSWNCQIIVSLVSTE